MNIENIKIGQHWQEVDNRFVRVIEVVGFCHDSGKVICKTINPPTGRKTKAMPARFNGKKGCYKLI